MVDGALKVAGGNRESLANGALEVAFGEELRVIVDETFPRFFDEPVDFRKDDEGEKEKGRFFEAVVIAILSVFAFDGEFLSMDLLKLLFKNSLILFVCGKGVISG